MNIHLLRYDTIGSTNDEVLRHAHMGAQEGLCVVANTQLAGKGREGRTWHSERDSGLFFSVLLRPTIEERYLPLLTLLTAVAVHDTVQTLCEKPADIKWPNDVLVNEKKISGILAERCETNSGPAVVVGIGINFKTDNLPEDVKKTATSIMDETGDEPDFDEVLRTLTHFLTSRYGRFNTISDVGPVLGDWSSRSSYFRGKEVMVRTRRGEFTGTTAGLDPYGSLMVKLDDGRHTTVTAGDVTAVRPLAEETEEAPEAEDVKNEELCENE